MGNGLKPVSNRRDDAISRVKWDRLEVLVAEYYRERGYVVDHCGTGGSRNKFDGGVDLRLRKDGELWLVQCKHWNAYKVAHNDVHQLLGLVVNEEATGGILATSGEFTKAAVEAAARQGRIQLIDGDELREMLGPLPDEAPTEMDMRLSAPVTSGAGRFAANAAERLVAAAEDRIRSGGAPQRVLAKAASNALKVFLLKMLVAGVMALLMIVAIGKVFDNFRKDTLSRVQPATAPVLDPLPAPRQDVGVLDGAAADPPRPRSVASVAEGGRTESEAAARERRRRQAEAMRILEASTPELLVAPPSTHQQRWQAERAPAEKGE